MDELVTRVFASLSLVALLLALLAGIVWTGEKRGRVYETLQPLALGLAAAIAITATLGSLYLSEVLNYRPCNLCWVQRFFMYPMAVLLIVGFVTRRPIWGRVASVLAVLGLPVSLFHRYEQYESSTGVFCNPEASCSVRWLNEFGFVTIPTMAAAAFVAVFFLVGLALSATSEAGLDSSIDGSHH